MSSSVPITILIYLKYISHFCSTYQCKRSKKHTPRYSLSLRSPWNRIKIDKWQNKVFALSEFPIELSTTVKSNPCFARSATPNNLLRPVES
jgi:hypothetical protein